jgi:predicted dehydrogenase
MAAVKRRDFVRVVGLAAATAATGWSAARKIRVGLLRTEHPHLRGKLRAMFDSPDYEVVAVCEPDAATRKLRQSDELFRGLRWVSQDELLGDSSIDLVVVECYTCEQLPYGRAAIAANKHLHLEKPPGNELAPFRELVDEARHKGLLFQMGYVWRFHPAIDAALEAARKGWLGDVQMVRTTISTDLEPFDRELVGRYRGGIMFELGGHVIDRVIDLLGRPQRVQSWLRHDTSIHDKLADNTLAVFEYDRALAVITTGARYGGQRRTSFLRGHWDRRDVPDPAAGTSRGAGDRTGGPRPVQERLAQSPVATEKPLYRRFQRPRPSDQEQITAEVPVRPRVAVAGNTLESFWRNSLRVIALGSNSGPSQGLL